MENAADAAENVLKDGLLDSLLQFQMTKRAVKPAKNISAGDKFANMHEFRNAVKRFAVQNGHNFLVAWGPCTIDSRGDSNGG